MEIIMDQVKESAFSRINEDLSRYNRTGSFGFRYRIVGQEKHESKPQETLNEPTIVPDNTDNEDKGEKSLDTLQSHSAVDELINVSDGPSCNERINHEEPSEEDITQKSKVDASTDFLQKTIKFKQKELEDYKHELEEWDEVCEKKRIRVEENKQVFLSEDIDLSPDSKTLESFLTPEQLEILNQPLLSNPNFLAETSRTLDTINEKLDAKFSQIQAHIQAVNSKMRTVNSFGDVSTVEDTPRTLFKAIKNHT